MKKINIIRLSLCFVVMFGMTMITGCEERSLSDEDLPSTLNIIRSARVNETNGTVDNLGGIINFVVPAGTNIAAIELVLEAPEGVVLTPASGTVVNLSAPVEVTAEFGGKTRHYIVRARVLPNKIAFLGEAPTIDQIEEDDILAAALWTQETYGDDFVYIPFSEISLENLQSVNVVFLFYDQIGTSDLPASIVSKKNVLTQFVVEGGKMLLGGMGTSYSEIIGRDSSNFLTIKGNGVGGNNPDEWQIDGGVHFQNDMRSHPIYNFTQVIPTDGNGYFPIIDAGYKEDHNNLWDLAPLLGPGHQVGQFAEFEHLYGGKVLGVWSGVADECCPGIVEFLPNQVFSGTIIAIGMGGMEWAMNDGRDNVYASNIRGIYRNSIDYLKTK